MIDIFVWSVIIFVVLINVFGFYVLYVYKPKE